MVLNLNEYRKTLKGDFEEKVQRMNEVTALKKQNKLNKVVFTFFFS
jgi:precorrin-2 dehydrogenase/sirohydrochlorin ferrochelatase